MIVNNCSCRATTGKEAVPMCRILEAIMDYDGGAADTPDCLAKTESLVVNPGVLTY
jgi:hypothetical protein